MPSRSRLFAAVALATAAAAYLAALTPQRDPDLFHHLALGREILRHGFGSEDPFLYPLAGKAIGVMPYWLGSVALYLSQRLLGDTGPIHLAGLVGALLFLVLLADAADGRRDPPSLLSALIPVALAMTMYRYRATPRPDLMGVAFLAATLLAVRRHERGRPAWLLALPLMCVAWTNVHPSLAAGLGAIGISIAAGALLLAARRVGGRELPGTPGPRQLALASAVLAAAALASLATPSRLNPLAMGLRFALESVLGLEMGPALPPGVESALPYMRHLVVEMQPLKLGAWVSPLGALFLLTVLALAANWRRARLREVLTFAAFSVPAFLAMRFVLMLAVVAAPIAGRNLAEVAERLPERLGRFPLRRAAWVAGAVALAAAAWSVVQTEGLSFGTELRRALFPVRAAEYALANGVRGRFFNIFHQGGYLEWRLDRQVFQDGRGLLPLGVEAAAARGPGDYLGFRELDERYRFDAVFTIFPTFGPGEEETFSATIGADADWAADRRTWALVAFDDGGLLYLRRDGAYAALAARDEYRSVLPANAPLAGSAAGRGTEGLLADLARSVSEAPDCVRCRLLHAFTLFQAGRLVEAGAEADRLLALPSPPPMAIRVAAKVAATRGDADRARRLYRRAIEAEPEPVPARRELAELLLDAGEVEAARGLVAANLRAAPDSRSDLVLAGRIARLLQHPAEAEEIDGKLARLERLALAENWYLEGFRLAQVGHRDAAVEAYQKSLAVEERSAPAHSNLGYLYYDGGDPSAALREHRRAVEIDPSHAEAWYGIGLSLRDLGDPAGAARAFREYLRLQPRGFWSLKASEELVRLKLR